jgi:hypothetical protein
MTDATYTHYVVLVDRTGSMSRIAQETEAGIAEYVKEQAALEGRATLTLYEFDAWHTSEGTLNDEMRTQVHTVCDFTDIRKVPDYHLVPRGMTPLLDAEGMTITQTGERLAALPEDARPGLVIFMIVTDGLENSSREWTNERVKELITRQQEHYGWRFTYLGANQDAVTEAGKVGIHASSAMTYAASHAGTQSTWESASKWSAGTRQAGPGGQSASYSSADRRAAKDETSKEK